MLFYYDFDIQALLSTRLEETVAPSDCAENEDKTNDDEPVFVANDDEPMLENYIEELSGDSRSSDHSSLMAEDR